MKEINADVKEKINEQNPINSIKTSEVRWAQKDKKHMFFFKCGS